MLWHFAALGALAGAPTVLGAWVGGFAFAPGWAALAFGLAAGAIAQVIWQIARSMDNGKRVLTGMGILGLISGFLIMYITGLATA